MKWDTAFRVVAHELRSPAGVISGYTRLLKSGRLDADGEASALAQIDRASERLQNLGEAAAGLSHWLEPKTAAGQTFDVLALVDQAMQLTSAKDRIRVVHGGHVDHWHVRTDEPAAIALALAAAINATIRERAAATDQLQVGVYNTDAIDRCDVLISTRAFDPALPPALAASPAFSLIECGGLGLQVVLASAVLEAHGAEWRSMDGDPGLNGIRLPVVSVTL